MAGGPHAAARPADRVTPAEIALIAAVLAGAAILRFAVADYSLWFDEFASMYFAEQPLSRLWSDWMVRETNPPLYYSLLHLWMGAFGHAEATIRSLSVIAGVGGIALLAALVRPRYGARTAFAVVLLAAVSAHHIYYSLLARGYIFAFGGVVVSLFGILAMIEQPRLSRPAAARAIALYAAGSLIAIYSHTTMLLWPGIASACVVALRWRTLFADRARLLAILALANLVVLAGAGWWLYITALQLTGVNNNISWIKPSSGRELARMFSRSSFLVRGIDHGERITFVVIAAFALAAVTRTWRMRATQALVVLAVASFVGLFAASLLKPILTPATLFWISIFPLLLVAIGIGACRTWIGYGLSLALVAGLFAANLAWSRWTFLELGNYTQAIRHVAAQPGRVLVVEGEPMGNVMEHACRVTYSRAATCPIRIVTLETSRTSDAWATASTGRPVLPWRRLPSFVSPEAEIFTFRRPWIYDPALKIYLSYGQGRASWKRKSDFDGPFTLAQFARVTNYPRPGTPPRVPYPDR